MAQNFEVFQLQPLSWEDDVEEERFKLSVIDPTPNAAYNHYVLFFRLDESKRAETVTVLKKALEIVLRYKNENSEQYLDRASAN